MDPNKWLFYTRFLMDEAGDKGGTGGGSGGDAGSGAGGAGGTGGGDATAALLAEIKAMRAEITALKGSGGGGKAGDPDPTLAEIKRANEIKERQRSEQEKIVAATKFNERLGTFMKEYAGVLPADANEIPKVASPDKYPDEIQRALALKAALVESFFKEEKNEKLLTESQFAKLKTWRSLGTEARREDANAIYETVFEPALNQARAIRQAEIRKTEDTFKGSSDSEIIFKKVHEKRLRELKGYQLNSVLHEQAKSLGLVTD